MRFYLVFLFSISAFAQDRTVKFEGRVRQGGAPNYIQQFMIFVGDTSQELGLTASVRPGAVEKRARIMYLEVTGPKEKIEALRAGIESRSGVRDLKKTSDAPARDANQKYVESVTKKFKVVSTGKMLGSLLEVIKATAGRSQVTFLDAIPNVGGSTRFVTIQVKGQNNHLDNFHSTLLGARGIADVEALPDEKKINP